jgi:hypothetical protein
MDYHDSRQHLNRMTAELVTWLELCDPDLVVRRIASWKETEWQALQLAILMQGVGPYLYTRLSETPLYSRLPRSLQSWLEQLYALNKMRLERMEEELATILRCANHSGIPIMPLKGSLLTWRFYPQLWTRPMADLDLLVRPQDREGVIAIMGHLGYRFEPGDSNQASNHLVFMNPGAAVVSLDSEHPDNPRPVEIHWRLQKETWGRINRCDFTERMWLSAQEIRLLGEPAWQPDLTVMAEYIAYHASYHLVFGAARLVQWLDLAHISSHLPAFLPVYPDWTYPSFKLAARALPHLFHFDLASWTPHVHRQIVSWGEQVPLDGRCGLTLGPPPHLARRARLHWTRWRPAPWRMRLGYYDLPLPLAYPYHFLRWGFHLWKKYQERRRPQGLSL